MLKIYLLGVKGKSYMDLISIQLFYANYNCFDQILCLLIRARSYFFSFLNYVKVYIIYRLAWILL